LTLIDIFNYKTVEHIKDCYSTKHTKSFTDHEISTAYTSLLQLEAKDVLANINGERRPPKGLKNVVFFVPGDLDL